MIYNRRKNFVHDNCLIIQISNIGEFLWNVYGNWYCDDIVEVWLRGIPRSKPFGVTNAVRYRSLQIC